MNLKVLKKMERFFWLEAFILKTQIIGELHRQVVLFSAELGLFNAIAHGAQKITGKLHSLTESFIHGRFFIYHQPQKDSNKIKDVVVLKNYPSLRQSLSKFYTANLFAEIVLASFGGGAAKQEIYQLYQESFEQLEIISEGKTGYLVLQFILRFLEKSGHPFELESCALCQRALTEKEALYYLRPQGVFVCKSCAGDFRQVFTPGARAYFHKTIHMDLATAMAVSLSQASLAEFKALCYCYLQDQLGTKLNTLSLGKDLL